MSVTNDFQLKDFSQSQLSASDVDKEQSAVVESVAKIYRGLPKPDFSHKRTSAQNDFLPDSDQPLTKSPKRPGQTSSKIQEGLPQPDFTIFQGDVSQRPHTSPNSSPNRALKDSPRTHLAKQLSKLEPMKPRNLSAEMEEDLPPLQSKPKRDSLMIAKTALAMFEVRKESEQEKKPVMVATHRRPQTSYMASRTPLSSSSSDMMRRRRSDPARMTGFSVQGSLKPLNIHMSKTKSYEDHARYVMGRIKSKYKVFLNIMIGDKGLGNPVSKQDFDRLYSDLTELVALLDRKNLDDYVLRHHDLDPERRIKTGKIKDLSHKVVEQLVSLGFKGPEDKLLFWSGRLAQEKAKEIEGGVTDEEILLLQALWGLDGFVSKAEDGIYQSFEDAQGQTQNSIHTKLIVAFSSILAEYAAGKEVDYFLGYQDSALNVSSAFWQGELPVLKEMASKVNLYYIKSDGQWVEEPIDLRSAEAQEVLDTLQIRRIDYGEVKGPRQSQSFVEVGKVKDIAIKWKMLSRLNKYIEKAELLSPPFEKEPAVAQALL